MANFSSFFPVTAAGGGGGFTKMNKYSTFRATDDATHKQGPDLSGNTNQNKTTGATTMQFAGGSIGSSSTNSFTNVTNSMSGYKFTHNSTEHTITANPAFNYGYDVVFTFTPALTANLNYNTSISFTTPTLTVNPATDLGLSDGDSIGYFMVGGGFSAYTNGNNATGMPGGNILQGTAIISNASTDLTLSIGVGGNRSTPSESTISGGLTLTTADGSNIAGFGATTNQNSGRIMSSTAGTGIMGYGVGGGHQYGGGASASSDSHGWGSGGLRGGPNSQNNQAGDGAILLFY